jgi:hypothetical protein
MRVAEQAVRMAQGFLLPMGGRVAALAVAVRALRQVRKVTRFFRRLF